MPFLNQNANRNYGTTEIIPPWLRNNQNPSAPVMSPPAWTQKSRQSNSPQKWNQETIIPVQFERNTPSIQLNPQLQSQSQQSTSIPASQPHPWRRNRCSPPEMMTDNPALVGQRGMRSNAPTNCVLYPETQRLPHRPKPQPQITILKPSQMLPKIPPQPILAKVPPPPPAMSRLPPPVPVPKAPQNHSLGGQSAAVEKFVRKPMTMERAAKIAALRSRPRGRPDWSDMMKEVESGRKLRHVQCNDRSAPILPNMKAKGQFMYESEKKEDNSHNKLLKEIQSGVRLKKVKCNDRSKPNIDGLRKFKREISLEDQIKKCVSLADVVAAATEPDDLDDIDRVREDLQSAKQMLALEIRSKEALEREIKRLLAKVSSLESEVEKERSLHVRNQNQPIHTNEDAKIISQLKLHATEADDTIRDLEHKYHTTAEELDNMRRKLESAWLRNQDLEQQLRSVSQGTPVTVNNLMRQPSKKFIPITNGKSIDLISDDENYAENEANVTKEEKIARELKVLTNKLKTFREKQSASMKERRLLRDELKKKQKELREEKRNYNSIQNEIDKMARIIHGPIAYNDRRHQNIQQESDSESSEESEEEKNSDGEMPRNASPEEKRKFLLERTKRREKRLSSLKKGNDLMKANIERLIDDTNKQREMSRALRYELNHIISEYR